MTADEAALVELYHQGYSIRECSLAWGRSEHSTIQTLRAHTVIRRPGRPTTRKLRKIPQIFSELPPKKKLQLLRFHGDTDQWRPIQTMSLSPET